MKGKAAIWWKAGTPLVRCKDRYPFHKILSHRFPLEEINTALDFARSGQPIRVALEC